MRHTGMTIGPEAEKLEECKHRRTAARHRIPFEILACGIASCRISARDLIVRDAGSYGR